MTQATTTLTRAAPGSAAADTGDPLAIAPITRHSLPVTTGALTENARAPRVTEMAIWIYCPSDRA